MPQILKIKQLHTSATIPQYQTQESSGMDLHACIENTKEIHPLERILIPTGIALEIPRGYEGQIRSRSGLALHHGIIVLNSPGTIDADYRDEVKIILINMGQKLFIISPEMRVAQLIIAATCKVTIEKTENLSSILTNRKGGFGSTGGI